MMDVEMDVEARVEVTLTAAELGVLVELLEQAQNELRLEISHSFSRDFRKFLMARQTLIDGLSDRMGAILAHRAA